MIDLPRLIHGLFLISPMFAAVALSGCDWASAASIVNASKNDNATQTSQSPTKQLPLVLRGQAKQSGIIIGQTVPNAQN